MSELILYQPPLLAVLESKPKLRTYQPEQRLMLIKNLVVSLLGDLGVSSKADTEHHIRSIKFINETCLNWTIEEIEKAFQMYICNEFDVEVFQQLNPVVIGKVMSAYQEYKAQKLANYKEKLKAEQNKPKEMSEQEKEEIMINATLRLYQEYRKENKVDGFIKHIYDFLYEKGLLPTDPEYKRQIFEKAKMYAKAEVRAGRSVSFTPSRIVKDILAKIEDGTSDKIIPIAKRIVIEEYFEKVTKKGLNLEELLCKKQLG
jgi:hypothetical protein